MWAAAGVEIDVPGGFAGPVGGGGSAAPADAANPPTAPFVPTQRLHFETSAGKTVPLAYMRPPPRFHDVDGPLVVHPPMLDLDTLCQLTPIPPPPIAMLLPTFYVKLLSPHLLSPTYYLATNNLLSSYYPSQLQSSYYLTQLLSI